MAKVTIVKNNKPVKEFEVVEGTNLRQAALANGVTVHHHPLEQKMWNIQMGILDTFGVPISEGVANFPTTAFQVLNCHGLALCGSCHVFVKKGMENLSEKGIREKARLSVATFAIGHEDEVRLACQTKVLGDVEVEFQPDQNIYGESFWEESPKGKEAAAAK
jgi:ferredoxin